MSRDVCIRDRVQLDDADRHPRQVRRGVGDRRTRRFLVVGDERDVREASWSCSQSRDHPHGSGSAQAFTASGLYRRRIGTLGIFSTSANSPSTNGRAASRSSGTLCGFTPSAHEVPQTVPCDPRAGRRARHSAHALGMVREQSRRPGSCGYPISSPFGRPATPATPRRA